MSNKKAYQGMSLIRFYFKILILSASFKAKTLRYHNGIMQLIHEIPYTDEMLTEGFYPVITIQWRLID